MFAYLRLSSDSRPDTAFCSCSRKSSMVLRKCAFCCSDMLITSFNRVRKPWTSCWASFNSRSVTLQNGKTEMSVVMMYQRWYTRQTHCAGRVTPGRLTALGSLHWTTWRAALPEWCQEVACVWWVSRGYPVYWAVAPPGERSLNYSSWTFHGEDARFLCIANRAAAWNKEDYYDTTFNIRQGEYNICNWVLFT